MCLRTSFFILTTVSYLIPGFSFAQRVSFPGPEHSVDPTKRFEVIWIEGTDTTEHQIVFKDLGTGASKKLFAFARHIDFFWAPDGNAFAVTNWGGSNNSTAWIGFSTDPSKTVRLEPDSARVNGNRHAYVEVLHWMDNTRLLLKASGYGENDPGGFDDYFESDVRGNWKEVPGPNHQ